MGLWQLLESVQRSVCLQGAAFFEAEPTDDPLHSPSAHYPPPQPHAPLLPGRPLLFARVLLMTGQVERAMAYLLARINAWSKFAEQPRAAETQPSEVRHIHSFRECMFCARPDFAPAYPGLPLSRVSPVSLAGDVSRPKPAREASVRRRAVAVHRTGALDARAAFVGRVVDHAAVVEHYGTSLCVAPTRFLSGNERNLTFALPPSPSPSVAWRPRARA